MSLQKLFVIAFSALLFSTTTGTAQPNEAVRLFQENKECPSVPCVGAEHAIVFVHGLTGSADTWKNANGAYWPALIGGDGDMSRFDVFRIDYDSFRLSSSPDVDALDDGVYSRMAVLKDYKSITIIAHSLGGLITQRYLQTVNLRETHLGLNRFRLAILFGTPSEGSNLANYAAWLSDNPTLRVLGSFKTNDYAKLLTKQMWFTMQKHEGTGCRSLRIFAGVETKDISGLRIVTAESAERGAYACRNFPFDHIDLTKPTTVDDVRYMSVKALLLNCLAGDLNVCPTKLDVQHCGQSQVPISIAPPMRCDHGTW